MDHGKLSIGIFHLTFPSISPPEINLSPNFQGLSPISNWDELSAHLHLNRQFKIKKMETVNTNPQPHRSHANNVWAGLIILAIGVIFLLDRLGFNMPVFLFSWPTLLIAIGIINGIKHNFKNPTWIILVIVGTMFLLDDMNVF